VTNVPLHVAFALAFSKLLKSLLLALAWLAISQRGPSRAADGALLWTRLAGVLPTGGAAGQPASYQLPASRPNRADRRCGAPAR
jgi:hypothetical protein